MVISITWDLTLFFILSQIFTVVAYGFFALSFATKNRNMLLIFSSINCVFNALAFLFLSAWTGFFMVLIALIRNIAFLIHEKYWGKSGKLALFDHIVLGLVIAVSVIVSVFAYDGVLSLLFVVMTLIYSFSVYQKNIKVYRILGIITRAMGIVYCGFIGSFLGMTFEAILCGVAAASVAFYDKIDILSNKVKKLEEVCKEESSAEKTETQAEGIEIKKET
ncbi:MAG: YgjV family protein [Christensenellaceae bacterium]|jgi:hypothetical protein|nr:YgjV family protein [Christensenellaceae bacterium]